MSDLRLVQDATEYFDNLRVQVLAEDEEANPFDALTSDELGWIREEIRKCAHNFVYAASYYFWITSKGSKRVRFTLWEQQEYIWSIVQWLWRQGGPAWIMLHKARQIGASTFVEALIAWKTIFFENIVAMIIADCPDQSGYLFRIMQSIYDHLPWWMHPMQFARERKEIIILDNPDSAMKRIDPGLNNVLFAQSANKTTSVGQGRMIHCCHLSEVSGFFPAQRAMEIIDGDVLQALVAQPGNFCIMESTPRGVGDYWHDSWRAYVEEGKEALFFPLYLPAFMENTRRRSVPVGFQPSEAEIKVRERYAREWQRCNACGRLVYANWTDHAECFSCGSRQHSPVLLDDGQLAWYRFHYQAAEKRGPEKLKLFLQEMSVTAEEGFQYSGYQVFPDDCVLYLHKTCHAPQWCGFFDELLNFHTGEHCAVCGQNHEIERHPLGVWELPEEGAKYVAGVDVAEGSDEGDYSVVHMIKIGFGTAPDVQVLEYRAHIDALSFGRVCYLLGKAYNTAMLSIEAHGPGETTQWEVMQKLNYPNIFNWLVLDKFGNPRTHKAGWWTNERTRPHLITTGIRWLREKLWEVRSLEFLREVPFFVKDDWAAQGRAMRGHFDDAVMAGLICIHTAHIDDFDPNTGRFAIPADRRPGRPESGVNWTCVCVCGKRWDVADPRAQLCPDCKRPVQRAERKPSAQKIQALLEAVGTAPAADPRTPEYDCL